MVLKVFFLKVMPRCGIMVIKPISTSDANAPPRARPLPPGPSSSQARRATMPFRSRIGTFCHPQDLLSISLQSYREIGFRVIAISALTDSGLTSSRNPMGLNTDTSSLLSRISLSGNRHK
jgi:hypothetical protein